MDESKGTEGNMTAVKITVTGNLYYNIFITYKEF